MNEKDYRYVDHDWDQEIIELEEMSNNIVLVSRLVDENLFETRASYYLPITFLIREITMVLMLIGLIFSFHLSNEFLANYKLVGFAQVMRFLLPIGLVIMAIVHLIDRFRITSKLNKLELDFTNKTLSIQNIDPIGKHFIEEFACSIDEVADIRLKSDNFNFSIIKRYTQNTLVLRLTNGEEVILFPVSNVLGFNVKRYIDLLKSILKI
ncbi:MAG: hypothetical protein N4A71_25370 [Carboxylicivirga sp.]|jgi:hypothetical protein|nr:hypothetical protein [Carboxylicivirga sp.]